MGSIGSKAVLWDPMGSKTILWGQTSSYGVRAHPMGSKVTHEVKGHPMGGQRPSYGGQRSPYELYGVRHHPMGSIGSKTVLWGQSPSYRVRAQSMGSEVTHGVKGHPMGGQRLSNGGQRSPYGVNSVKGRPMGFIGSKAVLWGQTSSYGVKAHPMGSEVTHEDKGHPMGGQRPSYGVRGHPMGSMGSDIILWDL